MSLLTCNNCGSILISVDGQWICQRAGKILIGQKREVTQLCEKPTRFPDMRYAAPPQPIITPGRVGVPRVGHKLRISPRLHTGPLVACKQCSPETAALYLVMQAKLKKRGIK